jgi:peptidoglycan hydrolase-like protein with peptidoglycan-binding domain
LTAGSGSPAKAGATAKLATVVESKVGDVPLAVQSADTPLELTAADALKAGTSGQPAPEAQLTCPTLQNQPVFVAPVTCRPAVVLGSDPVATLQQLLVMVGAYPGRVDGSFGSITKRAVEEVLGYRGRNLDVFEAIDAMDEFLCSLKN